MEGKVFNLGISLGCFKCFLKRPTEKSNCLSPTVLFIAIFAFREYRKCMILKPHDIYVLLKLVSLGEFHWTYAGLSDSLFMSLSEVHAAIKRALVARLYDDLRRMPIRKALEEYLIHGVKYAYPPDRGGLTRGIPTSYAAPPLNQMVSSSDDLPPVWPDPEGNVRGMEFSPLHKSAPKAAAVDHKLYELLALVDAIRDGRARERDLAVREIQKRLQHI